MKKNLLILLSIAAFAAFLYWTNTGTALEVLHPTAKYALWACLLGAFSAISLPLGSISGIIFKPKPSTTAAFTAFGAGALMAALSVELIAPTVMEVVGQSKSSFDEHLDKAHSAYTLGALIFGCILGGVIFVLLDELVNSKGGALRKVSTMIPFMKKKNIELDGHDIQKEMKAEAEEKSGAPMAIWLGILIDGIPESFVIGAGFLTLLSAKLTQGISPAFGEVIPYTLIAGLFLSNFPEALSSSIGMKNQGWKTPKIIMMWMALVVMVALGSTVGYFLGTEIAHEYLVAIEGLAAGAMLTMIAQTMIPEAVHLGGPKIVGLSTLIGYMSAVAFKIFE